MILLSIIVPVFDTGAYLPHCLESLLDQDLDASEYEIIVIDDETTDGSLAIAEGFAAAHPGIRVHRQAHAGVSVARNTGLSLARGRYVYFVDSDDFVAPRSLGRIVRFMVDRNLEMVTFPYVGTKPHEQVPDPVAGPLEDLEVTTGTEYMARHGYTVGVWSYVFERQLQQRVGIEFEADRILEDLVFTSTLIAEARRLVHIPVAIYRYVKRPGSIMELRSRANIMKVTTDWERAITQLDALRREWQERGTAPLGFLERLAQTEQQFVFFLIARFIRADMPLSPVLVDTLDRFRSLGMYPLDRFPAGEYRGQLRYHVLTMIFNRPPALRLFAVTARAGVRASSRARRIARH